MQNQNFWYPITYLTLSNEIKNGFDVLTFIVILFSKYYLLYNPYELVSLQSNLLLYIAQKKRIIGSIISSFGCV